MTTTSPRNSSKRVALVGGLGGFVGTVVMTFVFIGAMTSIPGPLMGFSPSDFFSLLGLVASAPLAQAALVGVVNHFVFLGAIFPAVGMLIAYAVPPLRNVFIKRGVGRAVLLGLTYALILLVIAFLPMMTLLMPQALTTALTNMNPSASAIAIGAEVEGLLPMMIMGGLIVHLIYGAVMGAVMGALFGRSSK